MLTDFLLYAQKIFVTKHLHTTASQIVGFEEARMKYAECIYQAHNILQIFKPP